MNVCDLVLKVTLPLEGRTWAIAESIEAGELEAVSSPSPLPPAVVTQHAHPPRQFILVSTQGSYLIQKERPVDQLRGLLEAGKGGASESVKAFFKLHRVRPTYLLVSKLLCKKIKYWKMTRLRFLFFH